MRWWEKFIVFIAIFVSVVYPYMAAFRSSGDRRAGAYECIVLVGFIF